MLKPTDYDNPWKEALARYFPSFLELCFPIAYADIDWSRGYQLLEQELRQVIRRTATGMRRVDLLVKVWRRDGAESWVYIYVEVQAQPDRGFAHRVRRCHHRIEDRYDRPVVSLAVLADGDPHWRPNQDGYALWGCKALLEFPIVKLLDLDEAELAMSRNPIAAVIRAHRRSQTTRRSPARRLQGKIELVKELYQRGLSREDVLELLRLIDWFLNLPDPLEDRFWEELDAWEKENRMPYLTSWERRGIKLGEERGIKVGEERGSQNALQESILWNLCESFGAVPEHVRERVLAETDLARLRSLQRVAARAGALQEFTRQLEE